MSVNNRDFADGNCLGITLDHIKAIRAVHPKPMFGIGERFKIVGGNAFVVAGKGTRKRHHVARFIEIWVKGITQRRGKQGTPHFVLRWEAIFAMLLFNRIPIFGTFLVTEYRTPDFAVQRIALHIVHDAFKGECHRLFLFVSRGGVIQWLVAKAKRHGAFDNQFLNGDRNTGDFHRLEIGAFAIGGNHLLRRIRFLVAAYLNALVRAHHRIVDVVQPDVQCLVGGFHVRLWDKTARFQFRNHIICRC